MSRNLVVSLLIGLAIPLTAQAQDTPEIPGPPPAPSNQPSAAPASDNEAAPTEAAPQTEAPEAAMVPSAPASDDAPAVQPTSVEPVEAEPAAERARRIAVSPFGYTGVLRVGAADSVKAGLMRVAFGIDFFKVDTFFESGDGHSRVGGILSLSGAPIDYLELWLNVRASSNSNDLTDPTLLQSLGDVGIGVKGYYPVSNLVSIGADVQATFLSGIGSSTLDFGATEARFRALFTTDFTKGESPIPLRFHLNAGYILDNSDSLVGDGEVLTQPQQFALSINEFSRVLAGAAIEAPFKYVTPYLEYTAEFPVDPQYLATPGVVLVGRGLSTAQVTPTNPEFSEEPARPAYQRIVPQVITPGIRVTAIPKLTLDLAVEIGITPDQGLGVPSVPPYNIFLFASYPLDPFGVEQTGVSGPPISVPVVIPEAAPVEPKGMLAGVVTDQETKAPITGAVVKFDRSAPVATADSGRFRSLDVEPGPLQFTVTKEGYEPVTGTVEINLEDEAPEIEVALKPLIKEGVIKGRVLDDQDAPIADVSIRIEGPTPAELKTDAEGRFEAKGIEGGYALQVEKAGFLNKAKSLTLEANETASVELVLRARPEKEVVQVKGDRIFLEGKVHFVSGEARLAPDAASLLDNLVDFLVRTPDLKLRIEGHTDNVGSDIGNLQLSRDRADAVKAYLVDNGISGDRLVAEGFGSSRPLAPNLTRRGREQNRRVEFHIEK